MEMNQKKDMIVLENLSKNYGAKKAVDGISLTVKEGEMLALLGVNGAGKSTLMKCMFGIYTMDEGEIDIDGERVEIKDPLDALDKGERKLIAVATNVEDPRNLGACIRSCLALGVDLFLIPAKGMCGITPSVARASAGALDKMRVCRPDNLEGAIEELKRAGYQILGLDADTETNLAGFEFKDQAVIAVGGEDVGLPPFIKKQCDAVLRIPMMPEAHSYNASVALSLGLYECARLRIKA